MAANDVVVKFDVDEIQQAAIQFRGYATDLRRLKNEMEKAIDNLRMRDWRGKAADKLFEIVGDDWGAEVDAYCDLMDVLTQCMDDVAATYTEFESEAKRLRLET